VSVGEWVVVYFRAGVHGGGLSYWSGSRQCTTREKAEIYCAVPTNDWDVGSGEKSLDEKFLYK